MDKIHFVETRVNLSSYRKEDEWIFKPVGRLQWLQRYIWQLLHEMGSLSNAFGEREVATKHVIDPDEFMAKVFDQRVSLFGMLNKHGQTLLIGAEDFVEMMCSPELRR